MIVSAAFHVLWPSQPAAARKNTKLSTRLSSAAACWCACRLSGRSGRERSSTSRVASTNQSRPALKRYLAHRAGHRRRELFGEIDDRHAAKIDALPLGEIEQQVHRPVETVKPQRRGDRDANRNVPIFCVGSSKGEVRDVSSESPL
jgi:hypothetical protein